MRTGAQTRRYDRRESVVFRKTKEQFGGLSNMAPGYGLHVNGIDIRTSEALYQACRFPHLPDVQRMIIAQRSPMTAKMKSRPYRAQSRGDWNEVRVRIMRWCLQVKLASNWANFRDLLLATGSFPIVEDSRKDDFWGAKANGDSALVGANVLGRLLMELREQLRDASSCDVLRHVQPLAIGDFLLYGKLIQVVEAENDRISAEDLFDTMATHNSGVHGGDRKGAATALEVQDAPSRRSTAAYGDSVDAADVSASRYPKRLIEADFPIRRVSDHARPEKTTVHGNISTLHIWWARRPHAACRSVVCASLWFDPADDNCPTAFRATARSLMEEWARDQLTLCGKGSQNRFLAIRNNPLLLGDNMVLRRALLDFIADFSQWKRQASPAFVDVARELTAAAHSATGVAANARPLVFDPFAGGGAIPLECIRTGADAFASDIHPLAVLLNFVQVEFIPRWGTRLGERVAELGERVRLEAEAEMSAMYPHKSDGAVPLVYLWARTVNCEGPGCGYKIPLVRTLSLGRGQYLALREAPSSKSFDVSVVQDAVGAATVKGGSVACPKPGCGYTTPAKAVRAQLSSKKGGSKDAQALAVLVEKDGRREFRQCDDQDLNAAREVRAKNPADYPDTAINPVRPHKNTRGLSAVTRIGMNQFHDLYTARQLRAIEEFSDILNKWMIERGNDALDRAALTVLGLCFGRLLHQNSTCSRWLNKRFTIAGSFGKQALQVTWDFIEIVPTGNGPGSWVGAIDWAQKVIDLNGNIKGSGTVVHSAAQECPLPADSAELFFTDPPYFAAIPYADLANFFYVWQRRFFAQIYPDLFAPESFDQAEEIIVTEANLGPAGTKKDDSFFRKQMTVALTKAREIVAPSGLGVIVFADSRTESWEALLGSVVESGWTITASWPIDTEHRNRTQAQGSASLQSSIHLVCRPRENPDGSLRENAVGDWRAVLRELPERIHGWLPRLSKEGVVGADAIFACLGPALEIFSRYSHVEKASGDRVKLREYLEQVWAAVSREALSMIFEDADATGLEEDARLTAMWLWTLSTSANGEKGASKASDEDKEPESTKKAKSGYGLEFDAARKIAQGLGAHLNDLDRVVEIKGGKARLLTVDERTRYLFGKDNALPALARRRKKEKQLVLFEELKVAEESADWGDIGLPPAGKTTLDRAHQAMILFAAGRSEALKRFLVEEGIGHDTRFWKLAQSLSALYPSGTHEKRWVDGVLTRKQGLGF